MRRYFIRGRVRRQGGVDRIESLTQRVDQNMQLVDLALLIGEHFVELVDGVVLK